MTQLGLAQRYEDGKGVRRGASNAAFYAHLAASQNYGPAERWLKARAERGEPHAAYWYAVVQHKRDGSSDDLFARALTELRRAAEADDLEGMFGLGLAYENGLGVERDYAAARHWYDLAGGRAHPGAEYQLGRMHERGVGGPPNNTEAFRWFLMSALLRDPLGEFKVAQLSEEGRGTERNLPEALKFYRSAAEQGHLDAQLKLGAMYERDAATAAEARRWYTLAAAQGDSDARRKLQQLATAPGGIAAPAVNPAPTPPPRHEGELTAEQRAWAAQIHVSQFDGFFSDDAIKQHLARRLDKATQDFLAKGTHVVWVRNSTFKLGSGRRYCFASLGFAERPQDKRSPRLPAVRFSGIALLDAHEDQSETGVKSCRTGAFSMATAALTEAPLGEQLEDADRTLIAGKPVRGEKPDPDLGFLFSSGFGDRSFALDAITSDFKRTFDYRKIEWVVLADHFTVAGRGVCIAAAGVAARALVGRHPRVPGTLWQQMTELDAAQLAADPNLEKCKARAAGAVVAQAQREEWDKSGLLGGFELTREDGVALVAPGARPKLVAAKSGRPAPEPFDLVLGRSSLADAQAAWQREGGAVSSRGYGDAKPSTRDNDPDGIGNPRVELIDVKGLPVSRLYSARFGFFDQSLYSIDYEFEDGADFAKLLLQVTAKYGPPDRSQGSSYEWQFGDVHLTLENVFIGRDRMTFVHESLRKAVSASHAAIYAAHIKNRAQNQRGF